MFFKFYEALVIGALFFIGGLLIGAVLTQNYSASCQGHYRMVTK